MSERDHGNGGLKPLLALSASAGSGKTFALVVRYLALLFRGAKPSEILAITFTNKAAGEMRERVVSALGSMPPAMAPVVAEAAGLTEEALEARRPEVLRRFLQSDLRIMTIDSFVQQILRKFCWYAGIEPDFEIAATPKERFFEAFLESLDDRDYKGLVDFARFEEKKGQAINDFFELLYEKEKELPPLPEGPEPYDEAAAMAWAKKLQEFVQHGDFNGTAKKGMAFSTLSEVVKKSWFGRETLNYRTFSRGYVPEMDEWLHRLYREVAAYYRRKERYYLARMAALYDRYRSVRLGMLKRAGQLHFKDIEHFVYDLLRKEDFTDFLYFRLDARIAHILFDEFQDTSVTQYRIFEPILEEIAAGGEGRSFFYVGDVKQSIYRFRGGQKALFSYVARRFGVDVEHLEYNYRSRKEIVDFVNETFPYVQPPQKAVKEGGYVQVAERDDPMEGMEEAVARLLEAGAPAESVAVLLHDNREILEAAERIRSRFGLPVATHKRAKVAQQPTAKAAIELMRYLYARSLGRRGDLHKLNFLSLTGRPWEPEWEYELPPGRPAQMLREIVDTFGLGDEATLRLMEFALPLHDLTEFVVEVEQYDEELPAREVKGIHLLTIHKSKGLEFDHVVVVDRTGKEPGDTSPILFDYEGIELRRLWMKFTNREKVDEEYERAKMREKALREEDDMNRAYVAFTRAKESLFVVKKPKNSAFGFLGLEEGSRGELAVEPSKEPEREPPAPVEYRCIDFGRQGVRGDADRYEANDFEAIYLGQGVHYLFETGDFDAFLNRYGALCDRERARALYEAGRDHPDYRALTEGERTHELPYVLGGEAGVVDLFVDKGERGVVVDYKTATPHDPEPYRRQVLRYKEALERLMPGKRIDAYIYYLDRLELVKVS